jgi:hypothetical protein
VSNDLGSSKPAWAAKSASCRSAKSSEPKVESAGWSKLLDLKGLEHKLDVASRVPTANEGYLEGTGYLQWFDIPGNPDKAIVALERATQKDPGFGAALL